MTMETIVSRGETTDQPPTEEETKTEPPEEEEEQPSDENGHSDAVPEEEDVKPEATEIEEEEEIDDVEDTTTEPNAEEAEPDEGSEVDDLDETGEDDLDSAFDDLPANASLHAADEVKKRLEEIDPCEKLRALCKKGEVKELEEFLTRKEETGVDIDYVSSDGWTCLHEIITHGCQFTSIARVLLEHGAKVNTKDFNQDSPLHASLLYHNTDNTKLLLQYGSDLQITNTLGRRPIHNANDAESLELLIAHGADVNAKDMNGNTALHYAVMAKDIERVKLLVSNTNCDINSANGTGSTPLHLAADPEIAKILLDGIPEENIHSIVNAVDNAGNSPLHVAVRGRHRETVRLLVSKQGKHDLINTSGKSPLNMAKDKDMKNILMNKESSCGSASSGGGPSSPAASGVTLKKSKLLRGPPEGPIVLPGNPELQSPSILKRKRHECVNGLDERKGPRLRFSEVNDYSGVEELPPVEKRIRVVPLYTEAHFSSEEEDDDDF